MIDEDNYFSEKEKAKYLIYSNEQEEKQRAEGSYGAEQKEPESAAVADDNAVKVGDKFRLNGREWEVRGFDGIYPEQTVITRTEHSGTLQYDVTQNIDIAELLEKGERIKPEQGENTDLSAVLDQSGLGGAKTRFKNNVAAIRLVNKLYAEKRNPTAEEQRTLSQFVGWGGLAQAFNEKNESWSKEYAELKNLLSAEDYEQARSSTLNAYYTAKDVIDGIYMALNRFGVKGNNRILEPAMGAGNFFGYMPKEIADGASLYGVELDNLTGRIAAKLYPQVNVQKKGFEDTTFPNDKFDIVVGNVPFGGYGVADSEYNRYNFKIHDYLTRLPSYDGSYLKFPEMNPAIELKPHQKNAVHRIITSDSSTLLHHVVGAGKTFTVISSIMKMRQLGLCKKAMVTVPNHLVQQWAVEWRKLYPNAHILVATKEDLEKNNRRKFVSKVALGDWDGIIIAQSSFTKIPISAERQIRKLREEIWSVEETIVKQWEENGMPRGAVKNLETIKKSKEKQLKNLMDANGKDDVLKFEDLGIDYLFVDEAHSYKNLFLFTKMNNVAGISTAASQRASDLKLKCEYLQELHGSDRGVVFATSTPISNSMTEMYTMQTYMQPYVLNKLGITFFDGWAANFGETVTAMELSPSGQGYRARTRFAKFTNLPELLKLYRSFADVQTADMVKLNVPEAEKKVISLKPSDTVIELAEEIADRADRIHSGSVNPHVDNMLKITSDGKKLALDSRCFVPESQDQDGSKLNECAKRIFEVWTDTEKIKGTQIVFCDLSTPKVKFEDYEYGKDFDAYNDLKYKLVQMGIPKEQIAYIHEANTDEQKQALFDKVNSGDVRVLLGSTEKCGAGTNVQKRLVALHHLDTP